MHYWGITKSGRVFKSSQPTVPEPIILWDEQAGDHRIATEFIGHDLNNGLSDPVLFRTSIWAGNECVMQDIYFSYEDAQQSHKEYLKQYRN